MRLRLLLLALLGGCFVDDGNETAPLDASSSTSDTGTTAPTGGPAVCGDGVQEGAEACDDGNRNGLYAACGPVCLPNYCGDGLRGPTEVCDDGNLDDDLCGADCLPARCGDGVQQSDEACDDGDLDESDACTTRCAPRPAATAWSARASSATSATSSTATPACAPRRA